MWKSCVSCLDVFVIIIYCPLCCYSSKKYYERNINWKKQNQKKKKKNLLKQIMTLQDILKISFCYKGNNNMVLSANLSFCSRTKCKNGPKQSLVLLSVLAWWPGGNTLSTSLLNLPTAFYSQPGINWRTWFSNLIAHISLLWNSSLQKM